MKKEEQKRSLRKFQDRFKGVLKSFRQRYAGGRLILATIWLEKVLDCRNY
jgi:hypothetical protein